MGKITSLLFCFSLSQEMMNKAQEINITYHPILDNFHEFDDVPRTTFNESLKLYFAQSLRSGAIKILRWFRL